MFRMCSGTAGAAGASAAWAAACAAAAASMAASAATLAISSGFSMLSGLDGQVGILNLFVGLRGTAWAEGAETCGLRRWAKAEGLLTRQGCARDRAGETWRGLRFLDAGRGVLEGADGSWAGQMDPGQGRGTEQRLTEVGRGWQRLAEVLRLNRSKAEKGRVLSRGWQSIKAVVGKRQSRLIVGEGRLLLLSEVQNEKERRKE